MKDRLWDTVFTHDETKTAVLVWYCRGPEDAKRALALVAKKSSSKTKKEWLPKWIKAVDDAGAYTVWGGYSYEAKGGKGKKGVVYDAAFVFFFAEEYFNVMTVAHELIHVIKALWRKTALESFKTARSSSKRDEPLALLFGELAHDVYKEGLAIYASRKRSKRGVK